MLKFMLTTEFCAYLLRVRPMSVRHQLNSAAPQICISASSLSDLSYFAARSINPHENGKIIEDFISRLVVLSYGTEAAMHSGDIRAQADRDGLDIPASSMQVAAHARSCGLTVVALRSEALECIDGLRVEYWI